MMTPRSRLFFVLRLAEVGAIVGTLLFALYTSECRVPTDVEVAARLQRDLKEDDDAIRRIINDETSAAQQHNVDAAVALYAPDATVRDAAGRSWIGTSEIRERYAALEAFSRLRHVDVVVFLNPGSAHAMAVASTEGEIMRPDAAPERISSTYGEIWTLRKDDGTWLIESFTYNASGAVRLSVPSRD